MDDVIRSIEENYDRLAAEYAAHIYDELRHKPLDRALLDRFAARVRELGVVCDMGCGPGHVARYLSEAGVEVFGLDVSPALLGQARQLNPGMTFRQGDMMALDMPAATLTGIVAFYAIVNIPERLLSRVFAELHRVLEPGGTLLLAFHVGEEALRPEELWGVKIAMDFFLFPTARIVQLLTSAGFEIEEVIERDPYPEVEYQSRRGYVFAQKPKK